MDESKFGTPSQTRNRCACKPLAEVGREGAPKIGPARLDPADLATLQHSTQPSNGSFNFG
jgi:hypothetical protein